MQPFRHASSSGSVGLSFLVLLHAQRSSTVVSGRVKKLSLLGGPLMIIYQTRRFPSLALSSAAIVGLPFAGVRALLSRKARLTILCNSVTKSSIVSWMSYTNLC